MKRNISAFFVAVFACTLAFTGCSNMIHQLKLGSSEPGVPAVKLGPKIIGRDALEIGDIVFNDGSAIPYDPDMEPLTGDQLGAAIAVIFYVGTECSNADEHGALATRTLGVGLVHDILQGSETYPPTRQWCYKYSDRIASGFDVVITPIVCTKTGSEFVGDKDGSDNLQQMGQFFRSQGLTDDTDESGMYPPFEFAKNYASKEGSHVSGSRYANNWYLPSICELYYIWSARTTVNGAMGKCNGQQFETERSYWSSSQDSSNKNCAFYLRDDGTTYGYRKLYQDAPWCCIREF